MATVHRDPPSAQPEYQDPLGCLPRIFWMMLGPLGLLLAELKVYVSAGWTVADVVVWLLICLLIGARYIDIVRYQGTTTDGAPATMAHFKRYVLLVFLAGTAMWAVARALGPGFE